MVVPLLSFHLSPPAILGEVEERQLLVQAGAEMAASGGNAAALRYFKLEWLAKSDWAGCLAGIPAAGLPVHTAPTDEELRVNDHVISGICGRDAESCPYRRLVMAFDRTYLVQTSTLAKTTRGHVLLGGPWRPASFMEPDQSQIILKNNEGAVFEHEVRRSRTKCNEVESCLIWDPTRRSSPTLEIAALPCTSAAAKDAIFEDAVATSHRYRGCWECLWMIGRILNEAVSVKYLTADGHGSHRWVKLWLSGQCVPLTDKLKEMIPFFSRITFSDLPVVCFPIGQRLALIDNTPIHFVNGCAHAQKNFGSQLRSCLGTIHWGNKWSDYSSCLELGLVPASYIGTDGMSDAQAALLLLGCVPIIYFNIQ